MSLAHKQNKEGKTQETIHSSKAFHQGLHKSFRLGSIKIKNQEVAEFERKNDLPRRIGGLLSGVGAFKILDAWKECAGPGVLKVSEFHGIQTQSGKKVLCLRVPDPTWRQELEFQKSELLEKYIRALKKRSVPADQFPEMISFSVKTTVPVQAGAPQPRGNKIGI